MKTHSDCHPAEPSPACHPKRPNILPFLDRLRCHFLEPVRSMPLFSKSPIGLYSKLHALAPSELRKQMDTFLSQNEGTLGECCEQLEFLDRHPQVLLRFRKSPEALIFSGLSLYILCVMEGTRAKIYRFHDSKTLVSCDLGFEHERLLRIGMFVLDGGFAFCALDKKKE